MAKVNLKKLSISELKELKTEIEQAIALRLEESRASLKDEMAQMATNAGFSLDELFGKVKGKKSALPAKYRNPDDPSQTYSGRGRKPGWLAEKLESGADMDDFLIG